MVKITCYFANLLLKRFLLNGHTIGFCSQTQKLDHVFTAYECHVKVLSKRFHLNGCTVKFHLPIQFKSQNSVSVTCLHNGSRRRILFRSFVSHNCDIVHALIILITGMKANDVVIMPDGRHSRKIVFTKLFTKKNVIHNKRSVFKESMFMNNFEEKSCRKHNKQTKQNNAISS